MSKYKYDSSISMLRCALFVAYLQKSPHPPRSQGARRHIVRRHHSDRHGILFLQPKHEMPKMPLVLIGKLQQNICTLEEKESPRFFAHVSLNRCWVDENVFGRRSRAMRTFRRRGSLVRSHTDSELRLSGLATSSQDYTERTREVAPKTR